MPGPAVDHLAAIAEHSRGFATGATGNLDATVEGCPGWRVSDLVAHLTGVQWFWTTIVEELLQTPPEDWRRPPAAVSEALVSTFQAGADRLTAVLGGADPSARCWTWAPAQQDVAFVVRHQAQEAAVHHWDASRAAGLDLVIAPALAADSVDEFLTFSVSTPADPADPPRPALGGRLALVCTDSDAAWTVADGDPPGTVTHTPGAAADAQTISGRASDLLLWLYRRVPLDLGGVDPTLAARLLDLCFTA